MSLPAQGIIKRFTPASGIVSKPSNTFTSSGSQTQSLTFPVFPFLSLLSPGLIQWFLIAANSSLLRFLRWYVVAVLITGDSSSLINCTHCSAESALWSNCPRYSTEIHDLCQIPESSIKYIYRRFQKSHYMLSQTYLLKDSPHHNESELWHLSQFQFQDNFWSHVSILCLYGKFCLFLYTRFTLLIYNLLCTSFKH